MHGGCAQCFVVSTLVSMTPAGPFLFRNYELPEAAEQHAKQVHTHRSSSSEGHENIVLANPRLSLTHMWPGPTGLQM